MAESQNKVIRLYGFRKIIFSTKVERGVKQHATDGDFPLQIAINVMY